MYDLDPLEYVGVVAAHGGYFFHIEQIFSDLVVDRLEVDDFDCHLRVVLEVFG